MIIIKTKDKISNKAFEMGEELSKYIKDLDIIRIPYEKTKQICNDFTGQTFNYTPILQNGVFICDYNKEGKAYSGHLIFECIPEENEMKIRTHSLVEHIINGKSLWMWVCSAAFKTPYEGGKSIDIEVIEYYDPATEVYTIQKMDRLFIDRYIERVIEENVEPFRLFQHVMAWINILMANPEKKQIDAPVRKYHKREDAVKQKVKEPEVKKEESEDMFRTITLNNITIKTTNRKVATKLRSRSIQRVASCWSVRGHIRHYKNGKTVYIKPYEKGSDKGKRMRKQYNIE